MSKKKKHKFDMKDNRVAQNDPFNYKVIVKPRKES